jgi:hypothetical protein
MSMNKENIKRKLIRFWMISKRQKPEGKEETN